MAKDPICGMDVDESKAATAEHEGETYYFCSSGCKEAFEKDPARHASGGHDGGHGGHH